MSAAAADSAIGDFYLDMPHARKKARAKQVHRLDKGYVDPGAACGGTYRCYPAQLLPGGPR